MSHVLGDTAIGDVLGGIIGTIIAPGIGTAIGAGIGGAAGSAIGGGNLTQDIEGGLSGAALGYGAGTLAADAGVTGLVGASDAGAAASGLSAGGAETAGATTAAAGVDAFGAASDLGAGAGTVSSVGTGATDALSAAAGTTGTAATDATVGTQGLNVAGTSAGAIAAPSGTATDASNGLLLTDNTTGSAIGAGGAQTSPGAIVSGTGGGASAAPGAGGYTIDQAANLPAAGTGETIPLPPVPPSTTGGIVNGVAVGNAATDAAGNAIYPSVQAAQAAGEYAASGGTAAVEQPGFFGNLLSGNFGAAAGNVGSALGSVGTKIADNPLQLAGPAVAALGLGKDLLQAKATNPIPGMSNVQAAAQQDTAQGAVLQNYLATGTLPPAVQAATNAATQAGITAIKSKYASMGIAPGSSGEVQAIAQLQQNAVVQGATLADQLLQQGISESNLGAGLYNELVGYNTTLNNQTNQAITNLATSLAGGGTKIQIGGTNTTANAA